MSVPDSRCYLEVCYESKKYVSVRDSKDRCYDLILFLSFLAVCYERFRDLSCRAIAGVGIRSSNLSFRGILMRPRESDQ